MSGKSEQRPAVTIGMPVYNAADFLRPALDALLAQTWTDFELILADNASTDATEAICREYAARDPRIRYTRHAQNLGAHGNFNYVLAEARAPYFMWAAHDDLWNSEFIAALRETLEADPQAVSAQGEYIRVDGGDHPLGPPAAPRELENPSRLRRVLIMARYRTPNIFLYGLHRTAILQRIRVRPLPLGGRYNHSLEYPILMYLAAAGKVRTDTRAQFRYRVTPESEGGHRIPVYASTLIRLNLIVAMPLAVWRGCRSLPVSLAAFAASAFHETRAMLAHLVRVTGKIPPRRPVKTP